MTAAKPKVGDPVRVFDVNGRILGWPADGVAGTVVKVGRKLITIDFRPYGQDVFRLDTHRSNGGFGARSYVTPDQAAVDERRTIAVATLNRNGVRLDHGCQLTLDQIEALAAALTTGDPQ